MKSEAETEWDLGGRQPVGSGNEIGDGELLHQRRTDDDMIAPPLDPVSHHRTPALVLELGVVQCIEAKVAVVW